MHGNHHRVLDTLQGLCLLAILCLASTAWAQEDPPPTFDTVFGEQSPYVPCTEEDQFCQLVGQPTGPPIEECTCFPGTTNTVPPEGFISPSGIDWFSADVLIVADTGNNKLQFCTDEGVCEWEGGDASLGQRNLANTFTRPHNVEANNDGFIIVADEGNYAVQLCESQSGCTYSGAANTTGNGPECSPGRWNAPVDGVFWEEGTFLVLDSGCLHLRVLRESDLRVLRTLTMIEGSGPGQFNAPRGIARTAGGSIVIADTGNHRVQLCRPEGTTLQCDQHFGALGSAAGQFNTPTGVDVDTLGRIWVADTGNHRIQVCTESGACQAFGSRGQGAMQFEEPKGIAYHPTGRLAVADTANHRIQLFAVESGCEGAINAGLNDAWFQPSTRGQGFFFTVYPDLGLFFLSHFTFDTQRPDPGLGAVVGEPGHRWLTAIGQYCGGDAVLDVTLSSDGVFDSGQPPVNTQSGYGTYTLEVRDCDNVVLDYDLPGLSLAGTVELERVVKDNVALCEALQANTP